MKKYSFSKQQVQEMYDYYLFHTKKETCINYNISTAAFDRLLRRNSLKKYEPLKLDNDIVIKMLKNNNRHIDIANHFGINLSKFRSYLNREIYKKHAWKQNFKIPNENIDFSNIIMWYIIGMILSDGHIDKKNNTTKIYSKYPKHLEKIRNFLKIEGVLRKDEIYSLSITNKKLKHFFVVNNINSDKRYTAHLIETSDKNIRAMIAGMFDGDGCIYFQYVSGTMKAAMIDIATGSEKMAQNLLSFLNYSRFKHFSINKCKSKTGIFYRVINHNKEEIIGFNEWLNQDEKIIPFRLDRKQIKFLKFAEIVKLDKKLGW